jgi:glycosyltransferase 2 family protein
MPPDSVSLATRTLRRIVLSLLLALVLLVPLFIWGGVDARDLERTWGRLSAGTYLAALGIHAAMYALRTLRFRILIPPVERPDVPPFLAVVSAYTMAAFILPAKIGEATFVLYANQVCGVSASSGIAALVVSRLLDLATLTGGFSIACFMLQSTDAYPGIGWFGAAGTLLLAISFACFLLSARGDLVLRLGVWLVRILGLGRTRIGKSLLGTTAHVAAALRVAGGGRRLLAATLVSIPIWASIFLFCAVLARGLGLPEDTSLAAATFGASLAILTSQIPISAFASFGTLEAGWVLGFGLLGVPKDIAVATGLGLHIVQLANVIALGVVGHLMMGALRKR